MWSNWQRIWVELTRGDSCRARVTDREQSFAFAKSRCSFLVRAILLKIRCNTTVLLQSVSDRRPANKSGALAAQGSARARRFTRRRGAVLEKGRERKAEKVGQFWRTRGPPEIAWHAMLCRGITHESLPPCVKGTCGPSEKFFDAACTRWVTKARFRFLPIEN